ncbi:FtsX-like permease family protein [Mucilaginibacter corticis]|uniref:FtsX-like permease family protein n=1 Tax=Mucilaginibacter corticis TaxID=2597670 RepID=A0A556MVX9_9SPHI|nr:ABC transporter permease [Mucilaginibacter corticis]TSJ44081.1 FtsX-like permease family protein [Mucilaginibacter corticis]
MFKTYFKLAYRNIIKDKASSFINITGLAVGLASSVLILLWVKNELSYDKFHKNAAQIYELTCDFGDSKAATTPAGMPAGLKAQLPVIKNTVRMVFPSSTLVTSGNKKFEEKHVAFADPSFMDIFSFPMVEGNRATALKRADGILITQSTAKKYFGNENPIGKVLKLYEGINVSVTGVLADVPGNSHLQFDFVVSMATITPYVNDLKENAWGNFNFYSYLQLDKSFDPTAVNLARLEKQIDKIYYSVRSDIKVTYQLQPLAKIHLAPEIKYDLPGHGNALYVNIFFIVAVLILVVACINFMNLATARSARRAKEIGLRKVAGAVRGQLIIQFLTESVFISFLSLLLAITIVNIALPAFNDLAGKNLTLNIADTTLRLSLFGIALLTGLIAGSYPALFLSGFNPVKVLKGNVKSMGGNLLFRNVLVVTQFMISIILLVGTVVIYNQLKFIRDRNPGFEKANLLYIPANGALASNQQALKNELAQNPLTNDFTIISDLPTDLKDWTLDVNWAGKDPKAQVFMPTLAVNEDFVNVFKMNVKTGRGFSKSFRADSNNFMVNEKMAAMMGLTADAAIGKKLTFRNNTGTIVGVLKDFNFKPIQQSIQPLVLTYYKDGGYIVVRTKPGQTEATIKDLGKICQNLNPLYPFKFDFVDQDLNNLYKGEQQMGNIFNLFAILGIFISSLGLYGLSAFMTEQRTKEIGVRKVLGASVPSIVYLLSSGITRLILIAIAIAIPLSWYAANRWLSGFAYHINVSWLIFFISSITALFIAWLTIGYESVKAAIVNPVKSLKTE